MEIIQIEMIETKKGSPDGLKVLTYEKGKTYQIPKDLAQVFVKELKVAKQVKEKIETAMVEPNLETEAVKPKLETASIKPTRKYKE